MSFRRYEILLPVRYNDGTEVEAEKFLETNKELVARFGACSFFPEALRGTWMHQGQSFEEYNVRLCVDVEDTADAAAFFAHWKSTLKARFQQIEIWMISYEIRIV